MALKDFKKLDMAQLRAKEIELRREIMDLRFEHAIGKLFNTARPAKARKDLARVLTVLSSQKVS